MPGNMFKSRRALMGVVFSMMVITALFFSVQGYSTGRYDRAQTGCECHGLSADPTVTVDITGLPAEYNPGETYQLTVTVTGGPATTKGGFNLEVTAGTLSPVDSSVQTNAFQNQSTHTHPNQRSWDVDWTAPAQGTGPVTFWAAGNAVNGNGNAGGDGWNLFSTVVPEASQPVDHVILVEGWNLVSVPFIQGDESLGSVLDSIRGYYDAVQRYDASDAKDPWKHNRDGKPFGNDLSNLNETMGFWVHITQPGDTVFSFNGTQPTGNRTIQLYQGWNLVGYPSKSSRSRDTALNNIIFDVDVHSVQAFNATTGTWMTFGPSDMLDPGHGYWILSSGSNVWEVPL